MPKPWHKDGGRRALPVPMSLLLCLPGLLGFGFKNTVTAALAMVVFTSASPKGVNTCFQIKASPSLGLRSWIVITPYPVSLCPSSSALERGWECAAIFCCFSVRRPPCTLSTSASQSSNGSLCGSVARLSLCTNAT